MRKRENGFTLVELMVYILIGSIVTLAGTTVLLMGLRMNQQSSQVASRQNTARIVMQTLEDLAAEEEIDLPEENSDDAWKIIRKSDNLTLVEYRDNALYVGGSTVPVLEEIEAAQAKPDPTNKRLIHLSITIDGETYASSVYCRLIRISVPAGESSPAVASEEAPPLSLTPAVPDTDWETVPFAAQRRAFLDVLTAQEGSSGADAATGEYFSEWYIGGYEDNPGWSEQTPWCACFVSWALARCENSLVKVPKFAHVDKFWSDFSLGYRKKTAPAPGDLIFFDWEVNALEYPQHVGVVTEVRDGRVYTVEGNADGKVAKRSYSVSDPCIIGYGVLQWK